MKYEKCITGLTDHISQLEALCSGKAGSRWSILLTENVTFVTVIDHVGNCDKEY